MKDLSRAAAEEAVRALVRKIQADPSVSDGAKLAAGLTVADTSPTPAGPPTTAPLITLVDTSQRLQHTIGVVMVLVVVLYFDAQAAIGKRLCGIALHIDELAVLDVIEHRAIVRAVMRAGTEAGRGRWAFCKDSRIHEGSAVFYRDGSTCREFGSPTGSRNWPKTS